MRRSDASTACDQCGLPLKPQDLQRDLAHTVDSRRFCAACRALHHPPPLPTRPVSTPWSVRGPNSRSV